MAADHLHVCKFRYKALLVVPVLYVDLVYIMYKFVALGDGLGGTLRGG